MTQPLMKVGGLLCGCVWGCVCAVCCCWFLLFCQVVVVVWKCACCCCCLVVFVFVLFLSVCLSFGLFVVNFLFICLLLV